MDHLLLSAIFERPSFLRPTCISQAFVAASSSPFASPQTIRNAFRQLFVSSTAQMESLARELGPCVEKARPYYTAMAELKEVSWEVFLSFFQLSHS